MFFLLNSLLLLFCCECLNLEKLKIREETIGIPVTFHPYLSEAVQVGEVEYFKIYQCGGSQGNNNQALMTFILPNNPMWKFNKGRILAEISKCPDSFNASCVLYTNYVWNNGINIVHYSNITFSLDSVNENQELFMRITSRTFPADYSFQLSYITDSPLISGLYDYEAFGTSKVNGPFDPVEQYARSASLQKIENFEIQFYFVEFCIDNFANPNSNWIASVAVSSSIQKPKSAFEIWGCSADDGVENCAPAHNDGQDLSAVSVVSFTMDNDQNTNLNDGFYIAVYGIGGEDDSINEAIITVTMSVNSS